MHCTIIIAMPNMCAVSGFLYTLTAAGGTAAPAVLAAGNHHETRSPLPLHDGDVPAGVVFIAADTGKL